MKNLGNNAGFWAGLKRPIYCLAPMFDVTDAAFRQVIARRGKPDIFFTEFVSCDGLCSRGLPNLMKHLYINDIERPIVAQVFGEKPETHYRAAKLCKELGFDGVDINMGCPVKTVIKTGCGAAMVKTPDLAKEIIEATKAGAAPLPVSVKTRIGWNEPVIEEWIGHLLEAAPVAITLHMRTRKEMSDVEAHWDLMPQAVELAKNSPTLILGNGDIWTMERADQLIAETGMDGAMLGRAIFANPWLFDRTRSKESITVEERFEVMLEHAFLYESVFQGEKNFALMRKHLLCHAAGFYGAKELRQRMENINNAADVYNAIAWYRREFSRYFDEAAAADNTPTRAQAG
jgi:nifR3 family TIM-barrel protein